MPSAEDLSKNVDSIISTTWNTRKGQTVPSNESVALSGGAVELEAVFMYADLASSSKMAKELDRRVAAKILKSFHSATCSLVKSLGGTVVSFDGDRVLGVFVGNSKNSDAVKCALQVKYAVQKIIRPKFEAKYESVANASFKIAHGVGIDSGTVLAVRAGVRNDSDLIWIGRAPNVAAKMSDLRQGVYQTFITASVYNKLNDGSKYGGKDNENMWEKRTWSFLGESLTIYRSSYWWKP